MNNYTRHMHQTISYWAFAGIDRFGKASFAAPVTLLARWQDVAVLFKDAQGQQRTSSAVIYPEYNLTLKGYVKRGTDEAFNPVGLDAAFEILQEADSPNLRGTMTLHKVFI